jgi:hypothetical protein
MQKGRKYMILELFLTALVMYSEFNMGLSFWIASIGQVYFLVGDN